MPKILVGDIFAVTATLVALSIPLTIIGLLIYIAKLIKNLEKVTSNQFAFEVTRILKPIFLFKNLLLQNIQSVFDFL